MSIICNFRVRFLGWWLFSLFILFFLLYLGGLHVILHWVLLNLRFFWPLLLLCDFWTLILLFRSHFRLIYLGVLYFVVLIWLILYLFTWIFGYLIPLLYGLGKFRPRVILCNPSANQFLIIIGWCGFNGFKVKIWNHWNRIF